MSTTTAASAATTSPATSPASAGSGSAVQFEGVVKEYGSNRVLHGVSLDIRPGEFVSLLGPSGCGKTTALRILAGLEEISSGSVRIGGADVSDVPTNKRDIGMVFQSYSLFPHLSVLGNIGYGLKMRKVGAAESRQRSTAALEMVGLGALGDRFPHELSGGQQQRVALARALVTRPKVLLLDEPLSALDAKVRVQLRDEIRGIQQRLGITTVFVTHDQEEALSVSDRIAVMNAGRIEQVGTPEELYLRPATANVAAFIGLSTAVRATALAGEVELWGHRIALLGDVADGHVEVLLRPENITLTDSDGVPGTVRTTAFLGHLRRSEVELADGEVLHVQHAASRVLRVGEGVRLRIEPHPVAARAVDAER